MRGRPALTDGHEATGLDLAWWLERELELAREASLPTSETRRTEPA